LGRSATGKKKNGRIEGRISFDWKLITCGLINTLNVELNPICYLLALLGAHHFLHVRRMRVKDTGRSRVMNTQQTIPVVVQPAAWFYGLSFFWDCGFESRAAEWMCIFCECCVVR